MGARLKVVNIQPFTLVLLADLLSGGPEAERGGEQGPEGAAEAVASSPSRPGKSKTAAGAHPQARETQERRGKESVNSLLQQARTETLMTKGSLLQCTNVLLWQTLVNKTFGWKKVSFTLHVTMFFFLIWV